MSLNYVNGNVLDTERTVIAHGVNCFGGFGAGVAGQIAKKWPIVKDKYLEKHTSQGWVLGDVQYCTIPRERRFVANLATQERYGRMPKQYVDYQGVRAALRWLFQDAELWGWDIAMPKIGCGLGGGDWDMIQGIILEELADKQIDVSIYEWNP